MVAKRILGIDPGLNITGYGLLDRDRSHPKLREAGVVRGGSDRQLTKRIASIYRGIAELIQIYHPDVVAVEELYSHYKRPRTAILMGHARGVICLAAAQEDIPIVHYSATQVKKLLTGNGHAPKTQMQSAIRRELALSQTPEPADVADALAIALCHYYLANDKIPA